MMPYPEEGFWAPLDVIGVDAMRCFIEDNCPGGSGSTCFRSLSNLSACIADINGNDKESEFGSSVICAKGSRGRLCDICEESYFYAHGRGCLQCSGAKSVTSTIVVLIIFVATLVVLWILVVFSNSLFGVDVRQLPLWKACTEMARLKIIWYVLHHGVMLHKYSSWLCSICHRPLDVLHLFPYWLSVIKRATCQIVAVIEFTTNVTWPEPFASLARVMSLTQLNLPDMIPIGCAIRNITFIHQLLSATLVPISIVVLLNVASMPQISLLARGNAIKWSQMVAFCVLPSTSFTLFRMFDCQVQYQ